MGVVLVLACGAKAQRLLPGLHLAPVGLLEFLDPPTSEVVAGLFLPPPAVPCLFLPMGVLVQLAAQEVPPLLVLVQLATQEVAP